MWIYLYLCKRIVKIIVIKKSFMYKEKKIFAFFLTIFLSRTFPHLKFLMVNDFHHYDGMNSAKGR